MCVNSLPNFAPSARIDEQPQISLSGGNKLIVNEATIIYNLKQYMDNQDDLREF